MGSSSLLFSGAVPFIPANARGGGGGSAVFSAAPFSPVVTEADRADSMVRAAEGMR